MTGQVFGLTRSQREEWNCFSKNGLGSEQFSIGGFSLRTRLALSIVSRGAPSTSYVLSEGFHRKSLRSVKKSDLCLISAQILSRLSLLARESQSILQRQVETCALQPTDFKVRFVK